MKYSSKINNREIIKSIVAGVILMLALFFFSDILNLFKIQQTEAAVIALRGTSKIGSASNGGDITLTFDTGGNAPQTGDVVFLWGGRGNTSDAQAWGPITAGYTAITTIDSTGPKFGVWYKVMGATPDTTVQGEGGGSTAHGVVYGAYVINGGTLDSAIFDQTTVSTGQLTSWVSNGPAITTQTAGAWVITHAANSTNDTSRGTVTNYTLFTGASVNETDDFNSEAAYRIIASPGTEDPPAWSAWSAGIGGAITIALKPKNDPPVLVIDNPPAGNTNVAEGSNYSIQYDLSDGDSGATVDFYYDTNNDGVGGTAIAACQNQAEGTNATCSFSTSILSVSTAYYIYGVASDAVNPNVITMSSGTITVNDAPTLTVTQPDGTGDTVNVGDSYNITYSLADTDNIITVAMYYDTDAAGLNGSPISGACATAGEGSTTCSWNTTGMTAGSYYIYGITNDGVNPQVSDYSPGQITINSANTPPTLTVTQPDGSGDTVTVGDSYNITYNLSDPEQTVTVDFYYDTDAAGLNGTAITGCQNQPEGAPATCSWNTTGMTPGSYYVYGRDVNDGIAGEVSDYSPGQITINAALPGIPGTPTFSNIGASSLRVSWTVASGADSYKVERCQGSGCTSFSQIASGIAVLYYDDSSLFANTIYRYQVRAINASGDGPYSGIGTIITLPAAPGTPTFSSVSETSLRVEWIAPTGGAVSYKVERCQGSGCTSFSQIASGVTTLYYDDSPLSPNTTYRYQILATNSSGDGTYSGIGSVTTSATPVITVGANSNQISPFIIPSSNNYVGGAFTFSRSAGSTTVTQIIITETGSVNANANLSNVKLYYETADTCSYNGSETQFGTTVSFDTSAKATFTGDSMTVGTSQVCAYAVLDVGSGATDGDNLEIEITNPSTEVIASAGTVAPSSAVAISGTTTLNTIPSITVGADGNQISPFIIPSSNNYVGGAFTFSRSAGSTTVTQIIITETGSVNANANLSNIKIYYETADTCSYGGGESQFGATTSFNGSAKATFTGDSMTVGTSQVCAYAVLDVGSGATDGDNLEIEITNPSTEVIASAGTVAPSSAVAISGTTTLLVKPVITSVSPDNGKLAGGTNIAITGTGFLSGASVTFGGSSATNINVVSGISITAKTPAHSAGAVDIVVTNTNGQSGTLTGGYTYNPSPTISVVDPLEGPIGGNTNITITGTGFLSGASVTFGGSSATNINVVSGTSITATTPARAVGTVDVVVTNTDTQLGTLINGFSYVGPPVINLTASPTTIFSGELSVLNWTSTDASSCTASGAWSGNKATTGNEIVSPTSTSTYTLTCDGPGGSVQSSVTVTVSTQTQAAPGGGPSGMQFRFDGVAYAGGTVLIYDNGAPIARLVTGDDGSFSTIFRVDIITRHLYSVIAYDKDRQSSPAKTFPSDVYSSRHASNIFVAPTINLNKRTVSKRGEINIYGYATPKRKVKIEIDNKIDTEIISSKTGYYNAIINADKFSEGSHKIRTRQIDETGRESDYSILKIFNVSEPFVANTDLNGDNILNIVDWSIFLSGWSSKDAKIKSKIDLNGDGKITISDLSIFLNAFSRKKR